jgi:predicted secreted protein
VVVAAGVYIIEFAGFMVAPLGVRTLKEEALDFIGGVERIAVFFVHVIGEDFQDAANIGAVRCSAFVNHVTEDQYFAGAENIRRRPVEGAPIQSQAKVAFTLRGKAAN